MDTASIPVTIDSILDQEIIQIATGSAHSLALTVDGHVYCWGRNDVGQLGEWWYYS